MNDQGTKEWLAERAGHVTASRIPDVLATIKTGEAAARANYRAELVAQRLTGNVEESYTNGAMQWGMETEPLARAEYEIVTDCMVDQVGFIKHPTIAWSGASPDGLIGESGLIEIKCPNTATHIDYLLKGVVPAKYQPQMLWQMECTGREWCDFVSFDPRMPKRLQLFRVRYMKDKARLDEIRTAVNSFLQEVEETIAKLNGINKDVELVSQP